MKKVSIQNEREGYQNDIGSETKILHITKVLEPHILELNSKLSGRITHIQPLNA